LELATLAEKWATWGLKLPVVVKKGVTSCNPRSIKVGLARGWWSGEWGIGGHTRIWSGDFFSDGGRFWWIWGIIIDVYNWDIREWG
jgi:hypothetical protein